MDERRAAPPPGADDPVRGFERMWTSLTGIGRDRSTGGYRRFAWTPPDLELRAWFADQAAQRGMSCEQDRNGNSWAW